MEPNLQKLPDALSDYVELKSFQDALIEADIIVKLVNHKQFGELPKDLKAGKQLINICG